MTSTNRAKPRQPGATMERTAAAVRAGAALLVGLVVVAGVVLAGYGEAAPLLGWDTAALVFLSSVWGAIRHADAARTAQLAVREDSSSGITDAGLLLAAVASLLGVGFILVLGSQKGGSVSQGAAIALGVASVVVSWAVVHTLFTLRYARLYYTGPDGGIDFNEKDDPQYSDFAYLSFTIGMTFQVSDTDLTTKVVRRTALRHALLSYLFGTVIIASTINVVAGLTK